MLMGTHKEPQVPDPQSVVYTSRIISIMAFITLHEIRICYTQPCDIV